MIFKKRTHVNRYETEKNEVVYSDMPFMLDSVEYGIPTRVTLPSTLEGATFTEEDMHNRKLAIAKKHVEWYTGKAANVKTLDDVLQAGGMIEPGDVPSEFQLVASFLFGMVLGMKRANRVWISPSVSIPEYYSTKRLQDACATCVERGAVILKRDRTFALKWAAMEDELFENTWGSLNLEFELSDLSPNVSADSFDPEKHGLTFSTYRCCDAIISKKKIAVSMTSLFHSRTTPRLAPIYHLEAEPQLRHATYAEIQHELFLGKAHLPYVLTVSMLGDFSITPLANARIQMRCFAPYRSFKTKDLFWISMKTEGPHNMVRVFDCKDSEIPENYYIDLETLYTFAAPMRSATYDAFAKSSSNFDVIILMKPLKHRRFYMEALARARTVIYLHIRASQKLE